MKESILFIGGAGFIGHCLVNKFVKEKTYKVLVLEPENANIDRLESLSSQITIFHGDLRDSLFVEKIFSNNNILFVVHLVSTLLPASTLEDYQNEMNNLILPSMNLMKLCSEFNIQFVYFSSGGAIYGNSLNGFHDENDNPEPISYYGLSKFVMEEAIKFENRRSNLNYLIIRPSNPFGPGQNINGKQGLIAVAIGKIVNNKPITIWGDGETIRDYIYVDDLVDCVFNLLIKKTRNLTINIGSGIGYSVNEIIDYIRLCSKKPLRIEYKNKRDVDVSKIVLKIDLLNSLIEFKAKDIKKCIQSYARDILE